MYSGPPKFRLPRSNKGQMPGRARSAMIFMTARKTNIAKAATQGELVVIAAARTGTGLLWPESRKDQDGTDGDRAGGDGEDSGLDCRRFALHARKPAHGVEL